MESRFYVVVSVESLACRGKVARGGKVEDGGTKGSQREQRGRNLAAKRLGSERW